MEQEVTVYVATIPADADVSKTAEPLFPPTRQAEILSCASEKKRLEKYFAWKLLEAAMLHRFGKGLKEFSFQKSKSGKWKCDGVEFSLAHSESAVCVALSTRPVGIDIEKIRHLKSDAFSTKILSEAELAAYHGTHETEKSEFLIQAWTRKESLFKVLDASGFWSADPKHFTGETKQETLTLSTERYSLAVSAQEAFTLSPIILIEL